MYSLLKISLPKHASCCRRFFFFFFPPTLFVVRFVSHKCFPVQTIIVLDGVAYAPVLVVVVVVVLVAWSVAAKTATMQPTTTVMTTTQTTTARRTRTTWLRAAERRAAPDRSVCPPGGTGEDASQATRVQARNRILLMRHNYCNRATAGHVACSCCCFADASVAVVVN